MTRTRRAWLWPLGVAALIFYASSRPAVVGWQFPGLDKVVHFLVYGLLAALTRRQLGAGWRASALTVAVVSAYGASDEWHQSFVPGRMMEVGDWVADTAGAVVAVMLSQGWKTRRDRRGRAEADSSEARRTEERGNTGGT